MENICCVRLHSIQTFFHTFRANKHPMWPMETWIGRVNVVSHGRWLVHVDLGGGHCGR
jgi:hypothetical protein